MVRQIFIKNFTALGLVQVTNYLLPLLVVPYLIRKIGIENFGLISFVQALIAYYTVVVDYGFNLTTTQKIAVQRTDMNALASLASITLVAKLVLAGGMLIIHVLLCLLIPSLNAQFMLMMGGFLIVVTQLLFPIWFFQGMEKMQFITILNMASKVIVLLMVFAVVHTADDYIWVLPIFAVANLITGIAGIVTMIRVINVKLKLPAWHEVVGQWKEGFPVFLSNISVTSYNSAPYLILSFFTTQTVIGYYGVAEKVMQVVRQFCGVFSQAVYPQVCKLATESHLNLVKMWKSLFIPFLIPYTLGCAVLFALSDYITFLLTGHDQPEISLLIKLMVCVPPIVFTNIPSFQTLMAYQHRKEILVVLVGASLLNAILVTFMSWKFQAVGATVSLIATEVLISAGLFIQLQKVGKEFSLLKK